MITKEQSQKIYILSDQQFSYPILLILTVFDITDGRTGNFASMSSKEASKLIHYFETDNPEDRMRKRIFSLAYDAGLIRNLVTAKWQLNRFLLKHGRVKKELCLLDNNELLEVVIQFQNIIKNKQQREAIRSTKSLLEGLHISVKKSMLTTK
ncbi:MAG: hypothetical protein WKF85_06605 [Chitinophagaceae bacterium]